MLKANGDDNTGLDISVTVGIFWNGRADAMMENRESEENLSFRPVEISCS